MPDTSLAFPIPVCYPAWRLAWPAGRFLRKGDPGGLPLQPAPPDPSGGSMSIRVMNWVFQNSRATLADRLVLLALADNANDWDWACWPSVETISKKAMVSERTVQRSIRELESVGRIAIRTGGGAGKRNCYVILKGCQSDTVSPIENGDVGAGTVTSTPENGDIYDTAILIEPSENRHIEPSCDFPPDSKIPPAKPASLPAQGNRRGDPPDSAAPGDPGQQGEQARDPAEGTPQPPPVLFRPTSRPAKVLTECAELLGKRYHPSPSDKGHLERQDAAQRAIDQGTWQTWRQSLWDALVTADN